MQRFNGIQTIMRRVEAAAQKKKHHQIIALLGRNRSLFAVTNDLAARTFSLL